ncbi:hypothetical protein NKR19_g7892 [Coniochaeta hoffmannii]|uniref:Cellobiose dehydrogenase-like cytochrome domain-containing protein n=1 Tax=Coniochaeta hoffmannii TaxID=91930 RepID=A0AA38R7L1_9PEZI|nr:hypothetical protein NKR19_g7892 [Coniochaeta hoffmannii]
MKFSPLPLIPLLLPSLVLAQNASSPAGNVVTFSDPGIQLDISLAIPNTTAAPFPLLVTFSAPLSVGWAGFATGGCMLRSPLIVAWPNNKSVVATTRWATAFHPPTPYLNTTLSVLSSSVNATHWSARVLCEKGCSDWYGGAIDPNNNNATFGYGASSHAPTAPGDGEEWG